MTTTLRIWLYVAIVMIATYSIQSCKKDSLTSTLLAGTWRVLPSVGAQPQYYLFTTDKQLYVLNSKALYRNIDHQSYQLKDNVISIQSNQGSNSLYAITTTDDMLMLTSDKRDTIRLQRDALGPKAITDWAREIVVSDRFVDTAQSTDITYNGGRLYAGYYNNATTNDDLLTYSLADKKVINQVGTGASFSGIEYISGILIVGQLDVFRAMDPITGNISFPSATLTGSYIYHLTGNSTTVMAVAGGKINDYDYVNSNWGNQTIDDGSVTDLAYANGYLYMVKRNLIYKLNPQTRVPLDMVWYLDGYEIQGIATDGQGKFYFTVRNSTTYVHEIVTATLP
jgi:hypothetical protein